MLTGTMVALITPFQGEELDHSSLERLVKHCLTNAVEALVPCGTTGEAPVLNDAEFAATVATVLNSSNGSVPVIAGCGTNSTAKTIQRGRIAQKEGVDAVLVVTPYYNKPNQESLRQHYLAVADALDVPLIIYNVPSRTGCDIQTDTVAALAEHPQIVGIKEATGSMRRATEILRNVLRINTFSTISG